MKTNRLWAALTACLILAGGAQARTPRKSRIGRRAPKAASVSKSDAALDAGFSALQNKEYTAAIVDFQKAAKARGDGASYFLVGYAYYQRAFLSGSPETADKQDALETVNAYTTALALDPSLSQISEPYKLWHSLAMSYEALGSNDKAMDAYKKAFSSAPTNPMLPLYAARLRLLMGDTEKSVDNLTLALNKARETRQDAAVLGVIKGSPLFSELLTTPATARVLHGYDASVAAMPEPAPGRAAFSDATRAEAAGDAYGLRDSVRESAAVPTRPPLSQKDQAVMDQMGQASEDFKFRRYREAVTSYGEVLLLNQDSGVLSPAQLALVHQRIGTAYNRLGETTEAIRELQRALQDQPFDAAAHYQLALAYSVAGQYRDSLHALSETFKTASANTSDLRRYMLLSKTDSELEPIRDLPAYQAQLAEYNGRLHGFAGR